MNRETIEHAASLVGGKAIMLGPVYDEALAGYTIQGNDVVAIYSHDLALQAHDGLEWLDPVNTPEDYLLDDLRETRKALGVEPIIMRTSIKEDLL